MKLKSDALEAWELEQWRNKRQADLCQRESKFKHGKAQVLLFVERQSSRSATIFRSLPIIVVAVEGLVLPARMALELQASIEIDMKHRNDAHRLDDNPTYERKQVVPI